MNFILLTSSFPRNEDDYKARWILEMVQSLKERGFSPYVLCPHIKGSKTFEIIDGVEIYRFKYAPEKYEKLGYGNFLAHEKSDSKLKVLFTYIINSILLIAFSLFMFSHLYKLKKKIDAKFVFSQWAFPSGLISAVYNHILGTPSILEIYGTDIVFLKRFKLRFLANYIIRHHNETIAISEYTESCAESIGAPLDKINVIPVGSNHPFVFSNKQIIDLRNEMSLTDKKIIFTLHRLIPLKGTYFLLQAMAKIVSLHKNVILLIGGEGPEEDNILSTIIELNLQKEVIVIGPPSIDKLPLFYELCDVYVIPSITDKWGNAEGLGMPVIESMSYGKPVVGFDSGGPSSTIINGINGFKVPEKDWEALADKIILLLNDENLRKKMGENGNSIYSNEYRWDKVINKYVDVINNAIK